MAIPPPHSATPPPPPRGKIYLEYPGFWVLVETRISRIDIKLNGRPVGSFPFKKPFCIEIPTVGPKALLQAKLGGMRNASIELDMLREPVVRVLLDYNRLWGNISFAKVGLRPGMY